MYEVNYDTIDSDKNIHYTDVDNNNNIVEWQKRFLGTDDEHNIITDVEEINDKINNNNEGSEDRIDVDNKEPTESSLHQQEKPIG